MLDETSDYQLRQIHDMTAIFLNGQHVGWILTCGDNNWTYKICHYDPKITYDYHKLKQDAIEAFKAHYKWLCKWRDNKSLCIMPEN